MYCLGHSGLRSVVLYDQAAIKDVMASHKGPGLQEAVQDAVVDSVLGYIEINDCDDCPGSNVYSVRCVAGKKGYGPLLYDYALGLAAKDGMAGLAPDRKRNTAAAERVWTYYDEKRPDVEKKALEEADTNSRCNNPRGGVLNKVYKVSRMPSWARALESNHRLRTQAAVRSKAFYNADEFETMLHEEGEHFFRHMYDGPRIAQVTGGAVQPHVRMLLEAAKLMKGALAKPEGLRIPYLQRASDTLSKLIKVSMIEADLSAGAKDVTKALMTVQKVMREYRPPLTRPQMEILEMVCHDLTAAIRPVKTASTEPQPIIYLTQRGADKVDFDMYDQGADGYPGRSSWRGVIEISRRNRLHEVKQVGRRTLDNNYWFIEGVQVYPENKGNAFGTELYLAAVKFATEHGNGLVSIDDEASNMAVRARKRVAARGIQSKPFEYVVENVAGEKSPYTGVIMTGTRGPAYPVHNYENGITASAGWTPGIMLHGGEHKFDHFDLSKARGGPGAGSVFLSDPHEHRQSKLTQAEAIAHGPFGGWLAEVKVNWPRVIEFNPAADIKAAEIVERVLPGDKRALHGLIHYQHQQELFPAMTAAGYNAVRIEEPSIRGYSWAFTDPSLLDIVRWHNTREEKTRTAHVEPVIEIEIDERVSNDRVNFIMRDKTTGESIGYMFITNIDGYWSILGVRGDRPHSGVGYGVELYLAAIKYASENGDGLYSWDQESSPLAKKARPRLEARGVRMERVPDPHQENKLGYRMTSRKGPPYPIVNTHTGQTTGSSRTASTLRRLYHGTSTEFLETIKEQGLRPGSDTGKAVWSGHLTPMPGFIYLTNNADNAVTYAGDAVSKFGGERLVLVFEIDRDDPRLRADEDIIPKIWSGFVTQNIIPAHAGRGSSRRLYDPLQDILDLSNGYTPDPIEPGSREHVIALARATGGGIRTLGELLTKWLDTGASMDPLLADYLDTADSSDYARFIKLTTARLATNLEMWTKELTLSGLMEFQDVVNFIGEGGAEMLNDARDNNYGKRGLWFADKVEYLHKKWPNWFGHEAGMAGNVQPTCAIKANRLVPDEYYVVPDGMRIDGYQALVRKSRTAAVRRSTIPGAPHTVSWAWISPKGTINKLAKGASHASWAGAYWARKGEKTDNAQERLVQAGWVAANNCCMLTMPDLDKVHPTVWTSIITEQARWVRELGMDPESEDPPVRLYKADGYSAHDHLSMADFVSKYGSKADQDMFYASLGNTRTAGRRPFSSEPGAPGNISWAWISPTGVVKKIPEGQDHTDWARKYWQKKGEPKGHVDLIKLGWVAANNSFSLQVLDPDRVHPKVWSFMISEQAKWAREFRINPESEDGVDLVRIYNAGGWALHGAYSLADFIARYGSKADAALFYAALGSTQEKTMAYTPPPPRCKATTVSWAWIDPQGTLHRAEPSHTKWAAQHATDVAPGENPEKHLLNKGWLMASNVFALVTTDPDDIHPKTWATYFEALIECCQNLNIDPEEPEDGVDIVTDPFGRAQVENYTVAGFVARFGGRQWVDKLFKTLLGKVRANVVQGHWDGDVFHSDSTYKEIAETLRDRNPELFRRMASLCVDMTDEAAANLSGSMRTGVVHHGQVKYLKRSIFLAMCDVIRKMGFENVNFETAFDDRWQQDVVERLNQALRPRTGAIQTEPRDMARTFQNLDQKVRKPLEDLAHWLIKLEKDPSYDEGLKYWLEDATRRDLRAYELVDLGKSIIDLGAFRGPLKSIMDAIDSGRDAMTSDDREFRRTSFDWTVRCLKKFVEEIAPGLLRIVKPIDEHRERLAEDYEDQGYKESFSENVYELIMALPETLGGIIRVVERMYKAMAERNRVVNKARFTTDSDENILRPPSEDVETLYHATTNARELARTGFRLDDDVTPDGIGGTTRTKSGKHAISFRHDLHIAQQVARCLKEAILIARGEVTASDIFEWSKRDGIADKVMSLYKGLRNGDPRATRDPVMAFELYRCYLTQGKRYNPLFFGDVERMVELWKTKNPRDVGVLACEVDMKNPDTDYLYSMHEYRVPAVAVKSVRLKS